MPHYTVVTRNREHRMGWGIAICLHHDLHRYWHHSDDENNVQFTIAIRIDSNCELYVSTVVIVDGVCENRDQIILTGNFNCKHPELGKTRQIPLILDLLLQHRRTIWRSSTMARQHIQTTLARKMSVTLFSSCNQSSLNSGTFRWEMILAWITLLWRGGGRGGGGVFSYSPIYNKMNEKTVRLFHKADWIDINLVNVVFAIRTTMTEDTIENYVNTLTNTSAITEKVPTKSIKWNSIGLAIEIRELGRLW